MSYERLMEFASRVMKLNSEAELAREISFRGYPLSAQTLNNWSRRGIPDSASLQISRLIGIDPIYLFFGETRQATPQEENKGVKKFPPLEIAYKANQSQSSDKVSEPDPDERFLLEAYRVADTGLKRALLAIAKEAIAAFEKRSEKND